MELRFSADPTRYRGMTTDELRKNFLVDSLFQANTVATVYSDLDRAVVGSAVPTKKPLSLPVEAELKSAFFLERREIGILNAGASGSVSVDGKSYNLDHKDVLYIGRGAKDVRFSSASTKDPAAFFFLSFPAHTTHPTTLARKADATATHLGSSEAANKRTIYKFIHEEGIKSCQLVLGFTELESGSVWNTMPPHTHTRRMEAYFYFDMAESARVLHLMGDPKETRHLIVSNRQVVLSPGWSIHAGAGTGAYSFLWGMGGENQSFADMDQVPLSDLL